jgi:L-amino acid N-acyltransferase YncA
VLNTPPVMDPSGDAVRVRRGRRSDVARARALLPAADPRRERFDRRTFASLASDVYVAEDAGGAIVGIVSVAYLRSVGEGRLAAVLDAARAAADSAALLDRLIAVAETRARRRGCRRLAAWIDPSDVALRAALESRGYAPGVVLSADLGGAR